MLVILINKRAYKLERNATFMINDEEHHFVDWPWEDLKENKTYYFLSSCPSFMILVPALPSSGSFLQLLWLPSNSLVSEFQQHVSQQK